MLVVSAGADAPVFFYFIFLYIYDIILVSAGILPMGCNDPVKACRDGDKKQTPTRGGWRAVNNAGACASQNKHTISL